MDIGGWLRSLGLERYEAAFRENEIDETVLPSLTHETLNYSTKRSNRHFLRVMLSRSISSVSCRSVRHDFSIPALRSLATGRWAIGLHRNTNAYPSALFSVEREFGRSRTRHAEAQAP